jgi:LacI family transcriptional regulator
MRGDPRISAATKARVDEAAISLGFRANGLARTLKSGEASTVIAVLVPDVADPFFAQVAAGIQDAANARGYTTMLGCHKNLDDDANRLVESMLSFRPAALIYTPCGSAAAPAVVQEAGFGTPVVLVDRPADNLKATAALTNNEEATHALIDALAATGIQSLVPVSRDEDMWTQRIRIRAMRERAALLGLQVGQVLSQDPGQLTVEAVVAEVTASKGPVAVIGLSVPPLISAIRAVRNLPQIPAFACFDTHPLFDLLAWPVLAVSQNPIELGRQAVLRALAALDGTADEAPAQVIVPASAPTLYGVGYPTTAD